MSRPRPAIRSIGPSALVVLLGLAGAALAAGEGGTAAKTHPATSGRLAPAPTEDPKGDAAHQQMMAEMMKRAAPGPAHDKLKPWVGRWRAVVKVWNGPGESMVSEGVADMQLILDGRFLEQRYRGEYGNQPFRGFGLTGYDNQKAEYCSFWIDNMSTAMTTGSGSMDESGKVLTMKSTGMGPDGKPMEVKTVTKLVDPNTLVFSMYAVAGGTETRMMEITYTRL